MRRDRISGEEGEAAAPGSWEEVEVRERAQDDSGVEAGSVNKREYLVRSAEGGGSVSRLSPEIFFGTHLCKQSVQMGFFLELSP